MTEMIRSAWSLHGVSVEMVSADPEMAAAAARLMAGWPRAEVDRADVRFDLLRADVGELASRRLPKDRCDQWPGLEVGADGHTLWFRRERCGSLVLVDLRARRGWAYVTDRDISSQSIEVIVSGLIPMALAQILTRRGMFSIHACAAARDGRAIVAAGGGGAGKSTLTVSLARAGLAVLSDDRVLIRRAPADIECLAWPGPVNLTAESVGLFPELVGARLPPGTLQGKLAVAPAAIYQSPKVESARPQLLLFPTVGDQAESRFEPLPPGEALVRLVPCSLFYAHRQVLAEHLAALRDLVAACRCYRLDLGGDVADVGGRVASLLLSP